ncbi:MAG TPA: hypothetical protein V6C82_01620, partial [Chroococcales cyanobacterium]
MKIDWEQLQRKALTVILLLVLAYFGWQAAIYFRDVLSIVVSGIIIAYLLQLLVDPLSRWINRLVAVVTVSLGFVVAISLFTSLLVPLVIKQLRMLF